MPIMLRSGESSDWFAGLSGCPEDPLSKPGASKPPVLLLFLDDNISEDSEGIV